MTAAAVVCEYNPFHNGHLKQFRQIRQALGDTVPIVCLMSGNFVQRGEPAIFSKMVRAEAALACGASLVLELPVTSALSSAEGFAGGAVEILERLGIVSHLCFGSECGDIRQLQRTANTLIRPDFDEILRQQLGEKISFAAARVKALEALGEDASCLQQPNDILAVEYCKALARLQSKMAPLTFRREGSYHARMAETDNPSATSLRLLEDPAKWQDCVPAAAAEVYRGAPVYRRKYGERAMLAVLRRMRSEEFSEIPFGSEGLWRRFRRACQMAQSVDEIIDSVKSKRYARSRICRMTLCAYLGITAQDLAQSAPYVRVLGMDEQGRQLLKAARAVTRIPILHAGERSKEPYFRLEQRCDSLFELFAAQNPGAETESTHKYRVICKK